MLDRWRMWFYRVDFDNHYKTRLITPLLGNGGKTASCTTPSGGGSGAPVSSLNGATQGGNVASPSAITSTPEATVSAPVLNRSIPSHAPVRGIGLPAGSNQVRLPAFFVDDC